jgi:ABC-type glycerol-3-phosphate transport system substrate-binding protein
MKRLSLRVCFMLLVSCLFTFCSACSLIHETVSKTKPTVRLYNDFASLNDQLHLLDNQFDLKLVTAVGQSTKEKRENLIERLEKDSPDALILPVQEARYLYQKGYLDDLSPNLQTDSSLKEKLVPALVDMAIENDHLFGIPIHAAPLIVYFNKQWFDKAKLPYPNNTWTWDHFTEISKPLMRSNCSETEEMCYGNVLPFNMDYLAPLIYGFGGDFVDSKNRSAEGHLNGINTKNALLWAKHQITVDKTAPLIWNWDTTSRAGMQKGIGDYQNAFIENKIGMIVDSSMHYSQFKQSLGEELGIISLPTSRDGIHLNMP